MRKITGSLMVVCVLLAMAVAIMAAQKPTNVTVTHENALMDEYVLVRKIMAKHEYGDVELAFEDFAIVMPTEDIHGISAYTILALYRWESTCGTDPDLYTSNPYTKLHGKQLQAYKRICSDLGLDPKSQKCSPGGELGPLQFMPATFEENATDGDGDGIANPWNLADAAASTGVYLAKLGYFERPWNSIREWNAGKNGHGNLTVERHINRTLRLAKALGANHLEL